MEETRFQPEESAVETEEPSVPGGGVLARSLSGGGVQPDHPRPPAQTPSRRRRKGPPRAPRSCVPIPVAVLLRLVTGPMWGRWARARRPGLAEAGVGGAGGGEMGPAHLSRPPGACDSCIPGSPSARGHRGARAWVLALTPPSVPLRLTENMRRLSKYPAWT